MNEPPERTRWHWWHWAALALAAYVLPLLIFLGSPRAWQSLRPEAQQFVETIYWPVEKLWQFFGWLD